METIDILRKAREVSIYMNTVNDKTSTDVLLNIADALITKSSDILTANARDLNRMDPSDPKYDRLKLTAERIAGIASDMRNVAKLPSPLGHILSENIRPNGMHITKISVAFGVIGVIYEARPNVTADVFSLCFRSGNICVLKGGSDAKDSNEAIVSIIHETLKNFNIPTEVCTLLPATREATETLLKAIEEVDLIIPRGSKGLIEFVRKNAIVPVIETGAGICHTYFDEYGDTEKGSAIIFNAKTRRVSVCNALDCAIINEKRLPDLNRICEHLPEKNVIIYADKQSYNVLKGHYPDNLLKEATDDSFGTEFLDYKMSIKTVPSFEAALAHIRRYTSHHSEAIITENKVRAQEFLSAIDAACVYVNVSTAFTDGAQFGLGAEIGISTQKLHARGPMALAELTTYKYLIIGDGQTRNG